MSPVVIVADRDSIARADVAAPHEPTDGDASPRLYRVDAGSRFRPDEWAVVYQVAHAFDDAVCAARRQSPALDRIWSSLDARAIRSGPRKSVDPYCIKTPCERCMGRFGAAALQCAQSLYIIDRERYVSVLEIDLGGFHLERATEVDGGFGADR